MTSTMKHLPACLAALALSLTLLPAEAAAQSGRRIPNSATLVQQGAGNGAAVVQQGQANSGTIIQYGQNHDAALVQTGRGNDGCIVQLGRGQSAQMTQTGDNLSLGVVQAQGRTREIPTSMCANPLYSRADFRRMSMARR